MAQQRDNAIGNINANNFAKEYKERANDILINGSGPLGIKENLLKTRANLLGYGHPRRQLRNLEDSGLSSSGSQRLLESFA